MGEKKLSRCPANVTLPGSPGKAVSVRLNCTECEPMYRFACDDGIDLEQLQARLRKMSDEDLVRFGKAARFMGRDKEPRQVFVIQLEEARAEWR